MDESVELMQWDLADRLIKDSEKILIIGHIRPDGDAIGSVTALGNILEQSGKLVFMHIDGGVPEHLLFLPRSQDILSEVNHSDYDLLICVDSSDTDIIGMAGQNALKEGISTLVVDHHRTNSQYGDAHLLRSDAVSTTEIIFDWFERNQYPISAETANSLLVGMLTDTQYFRVGPVSADTFMKVGKLIDLGADLQMIRQATVDRKVPLRNLRLFGVALSRAELDEGVVSTVVNEDDFRDNGNDSGGSIGSVDTLLSAESAVISAEFAWLDSDSVKVSLRAEEGFEVSSTAASLGGGGHAKAGGCTLQSTTPEEAIAKVLPLLKEAAKKHIL